MEISGHDQQINFWNKFILEGDLDAYSRIYFDYYDLLFDYGIRHSNDKQLVEDTIQDMFIHLIKVRKSIGIVKNLSGYLFSTFRRQLFLELKKHNFTVLTDQITEENFDYFKSPDHEISEKRVIEKMHSTIKECVDNLSDKQREILFLRFERDISYEEISGMLNISVDSCYKSIHRSIKTIRAKAENILGKRNDLFLFALFRFKR
jgi:RNA polymerase sigma factor (sigma-70 family)